MATPQYGKSFSFAITLTDRNNRPNIKISPTISVGDFTISMDGSPAVNLATTPTVSPVGWVSVTVSLSASEMTARNISIYGHDVSGGEWDDVFIGVSPLTNDVVVFTGDALASANQICNLALSHLGIGKPIDDLETDTSQEAEACRLFFTVARDTTLRGFPWPFATKTDVLELVEELTGDADEWGYSYRYPSDCLKFRRVLSGSRNDSRQSRVSFKMGRDDVGQLIFCDIADAVAEYTVKDADPTRYPIDFYMALSYFLAHLIAPRLTKGDPFKLAQQNLQMHYLTLQKAQADGANEEQPDQEVESSFIRERD